MVDKVLLSCMQCSADVERYPSIVKDKVFCSRQCYSKWQSANLSGSNSYNYKNAPTEKRCEQCGLQYEVPKHREDVSKFCSTPCYHKWHGENHVGENAPNWRGGAKDKRLSIEYRAWRKAVLKRDDYTCQQCDTLGGKLVSHHINSFTRHPELRFDVDNGATLCRECHISGELSFHKLYGTHNFTQEDYIEWRTEYGC